MTEVVKISVDKATPEEWRKVVEWADHEGWNVGKNDVPCFFAADPDGFFLGRVEGCPVSALSVVNYSDEYSFMGHYLVAPDVRGCGYGLATWQVALLHAGDRNIGLDAMPVQQTNYAKSGFRSVHSTVRYSGRIVRPRGARRGASSVTPDQLDVLRDYDRACFPADRGEFIERWLKTPGHVACAQIRNGRLRGYGVIRPGSDRYRIGPLFADTAEDAEVLFDSLTANLGPGDEVSLDVPETNSPACSLVVHRGLSPEFNTIRMYRKGTPDFRPEKVFGITSLELG